MDGEIPEKVLPYSVALLWGFGFPDSFGIIMQHSAFELQNWIQL